jgi:hypothetical protein
MKEKLESIQAFFEATGTMPEDFYSIGVSEYDVKFQGKFSSRLAFVLSDHDIKLSLTDQNFVEGETGHYRIVLT